MFNWQQFLEQRSTSPQTNLAKNNYLIPLRDYARVTVTGENAVSFLQGQCTNDFKQLTQSNFSYGAHCNPKGRMHTNYICAKLSENSIGLRVHQSVAQHLHNSLTKYAIFSKVDIKIDENFCAVGYLGGELDIDDLLGVNVENQTHIDQFKLKVIKHSAKQIELWTEASQIERVWEKMTFAAKISDAERWTIKCVDQGMVTLDAQLVEKLLPQEINLDKSDGVSFSKGCYTGQEVIARLHYKGQLKKSIFRCTISQNQPNNLTHFKLVNGMSLISGNKNIGLIVNHAQHHSGIYHALVLADQSITDCNTAQLSDNSIINLEWTL